MVLARLISPTEIGIYSVAAAFVAIAHMLRDFGIGNYLVQEKNLTQDRIRAAITIMMMTAWGLAILLALSSDLIASFYAEEQLQPIVLVLSLNFVLLPFTAPVLSLLRRDMNFSALLMIELISTFVRTIVAIVLAWQGFGAMSLAWAAVANICVILFLTLFYRPSWSHWFPSFKEIRQVGLFGFKASSAAIVSELGTSAYDLILGRILGFTALGLFSRAMGVMYLFDRDIMGAIRNVVFPTMALKNREGTDQVEFYCRALTYITGVAWPFYSFLIVMAFPVMRILFGDQWDGAVPLVQTLAIAGIIGATCSLSGSLIYALGDIDKILYIEIIVQVTRITLLIAAAFHSLEAVAWSVVGTYLVLTTINNFIIVKYYRFSFLQITISMIPSAIIVGGSTLFLLLTLNFLQPLELPLFVETLLVGIGGFVGWLATAALIGHPLWVEIRELWKTFIKKMT